MPRVVHWKQYHSHLEVVGGGAGGGGGVSGGARGKGESFPAARAGVGRRVKETLAAGQLHLLVKLYLTFCAFQVEVTVALALGPTTGVM